MRHTHACLLCLSVWHCVTQAPCRTSDTLPLCVCENNEAEWFTVTFVADSEHMDTKLLSGKTFLKGQDT